ncbi:MAG: sugar ABC transporter permease [Actinomycetia bacterium]|nr:sugar ABC transporter permease [Actinomycetes bacterium]
MPLVIYTAFAFIPFAATLVLSLYDWDGLTSPSFIGLSNFADLARDAVFRNALGNNFSFTIFYSFIPITLALFLAALIADSARLRSVRIYRLLLFVPYVMPMVVLGVIWRWIYSPLSGPVNAVITATGRDPFPILGDTTTALPAIGLVGTWVMYGFAMILFIAGIQKIDTALYDAARVDGANRLKRFRFVTLPGLRNEITVALIVTLATALRVFDLVFVMTRGGPARSTDVVAFYIFRTAFNNREVGLGAAAAAVLVGIIFVASLVILRFRTSES